MRQIILNPLFAPFFIVLYVGICAVACIGGSADCLKAFTSGPMEVITYTGYAITAIIALLFYKDFQTPTLRTPYIMFLTLLGCAVLREMGAQHWIPSKDTTAFKLRFFSNPDNPISEKLLAGAILLALIGIVVYLLIKYIPTLFKGFFKFNPICWTIASMGGIAVVSKFADRFPGNYRKATGEALDALTQGWIVLFEESGEATIPLMFAIAVIQWHLMQKKR